MKTNIKTNNNFIKSKAGLNSEYVEIKDTVFNSNEELMLELTLYNMFTKFKFIDCIFKNINFIKVVCEGVKFINCDFETPTVDIFFYEKNQFLTSHFTQIHTNHSDYFLNNLTDFTFNNVERLKQ